MVVARASPLYSPDSSSFLHVVLTRLRRECVLAFRSHSEARSDSCQPDAVIVVSKVKLVIPEATDEMASLRLICSTALLAKV